MITAYLDATRTQEEIALNHGYKNKSEASRCFSEVGCIFTTVGKMQPPYKITVIEDGKEIEKQFGTIDEYPKDKEPSIV